MMIKVLLVLAVMLGAAVALDLATATKTSELDGMTNEVLAMVGSAIAEIEQNEELTPNATEAAALLKNAQENPNIAYVDMAYLADINFLVNLRNNQTATIDAATTAYLTYRSTVKAELEAFLTEWQSKLANLTANRDLAVTDAKSLLERAKATIIFEVAKVAQKVVAAAVYILRARGASVELSLNAYNAAVWVINNTIASKNNSNVGGLAWTVVTNNTLIKEQIIAIIYASNVAEWRLRKLTAIETAVKAWAAAQIAALQQKVAEFKVQAAAKLDALKTAWASAAVKAELAQRFAAFLNASGVSVQIVTTTANVTVNVAIAKLNLTATYTAQEVKNWLAKHIKILLLAYAGAELGGIAEDQVSVTSVTETIPTKRQSSNGYYLSSTIGSSSSASNVGSSASAVVASFTLFASSLAALFLF